MNGHVAQEAWRHRGLALWTGHLGHVPDVTRMWAEIVGLWRICTGSTTRDVVSTGSTTRDRGLDGLDHPDRGLDGLDHLDHGLDGLDHPGPWSRRARPPG